MGDDAKKLVKEAYEFGYFVGYKGHSTWAEWVRKTRERLYSEAEKLGIYDLVKSAYNRGREDGAKKREEEINLSLVEKGKLTEEKPRPKVKPPAEKPKPEVPSEEPEVAFASFVETTRILLPPDLLNSLKNLEPPKMLRLGGK